MQISEQPRSFAHRDRDELDEIAEVLQREADPADPMTREAAIRAIGRIIGLDAPAPGATYQKPWG